MEPPLPAPLLSLVTGAKDRPQSLHRLIESIKHNTTVSWELIVSDASELPFFNDDARITILCEQPPQGHTKGYNNAFKLCRGVWVIWLNDDAEVILGYDVAAIKFMLAHPSIGLGAIPYSERKPRTDTYGPFHVNNWRGLMYANFGILRRALGEQLGWFDEDFTMYGADNSLAFRTFLAGYGIAAVPHRSILHHSPQDEIRASNQVHRKQAARVFATKYHDQYPRMSVIHDQYKQPLPEFVSPKP